MNAALGVGEAACLGLARIRPRTAANPGFTARNARRSQQALCERRETRCLAQASNEGRPGAAALPQRPGRLGNAHAHVGSRRPDRRITKEGWRREAGTPHRLTASARLVIVGAGESGRGPCLQPDRRRCPFQLQAIAHGLAGVWVSRTAVAADSHAGTSESGTAERPATEGPATPEQDSRDSGPGGHVRGRQRRATRIASAQNAPPRTRCRSRKALRRARRRNRSATRWASRPTP